MGLKVIGAGFGRTGTLSLKHALETLGFTKTHHMMEVFPSAKQINHWHAIGNGEKPDWDTVFEGYQACVDFPAATYYKDLMAHYPDAKVILTVRDADRWYDSTRNTIFRFGAIIPKWVRILVPRAGKIYKMSEGNIWTRVFKDRFEDEAFAKSVFVNYVEQVKRDVPEEKLLVFNVKQGWEPLCSFLGTTVPGEAFPHLNDTASMRRVQAIMQIVFTAIPVLAGIGLISVLYLMLR
jgi:hypothetical protein